MNEALDGVSDEEQILLNGSARTVLRIDNLIRLVSSAYYEDNINQYFKKLEDLYFQSKGYLPPEDSKEGVLLHDDLKDRCPKYDDESYSLVYDEDLPKDLRYFHEWLLEMLHKHKVTMGSKPGTMGGFAKVINKYGIANQERKTE